MSINCCEHRLKGTQSLARHEHRAELLRNYRTRSLIWIRTHVTLDSSGWLMNDSCLCHQFFLWMFPKVLHTKRTHRDRCPHAELTSIKASLRHLFSSLCVLLRRPWILSNLLGYLLCKQSESSLPLADNRAVDELISEFKLVWKAKFRPFDGANREQNDAQLFYIKLIFIIFFIFSYFLLVFSVRIKSKIVIFIVFCFNLNSFARLHSGFDLLTRMIFLSIGTYF